MRFKAALTGLILVWGWIPSISAQASNGPAEKGALIRSLVLPGWGQQVLGDRAAARRFAMAEAGLWLGYFVTHSAAGWYRQDYRAFAALHAGVEYRQRPDIYYVRLGRYDSITAYNQAQLRQRNLAAVYPLGTHLDWQWDFSVNRQHYADLRRASLRAAKAASFVIGGMVVNRAIAAIHVLFLSRRGQAPSAYWMPLPGGGGISIRLQF
ncbi:MAG: hypothetical protein ACETWG_12145 [Candidatus Neomarinimicrobiota bacterium]